MLTYDDTVIDETVWSIISGSRNPQDFLDYLCHFPERALHHGEAVDRLEEIDNAGSEEIQPRHYPEAIAGVGKLAGEGLAAAQFHMGKLCSQAIGCEKDEDKGRHWYELAVLQNEPRAMVNLALMLCNEEDYSRARQLYEKAAGLGDHFALLLLGRLFLLEETGFRDPVKAHDLFLAAWEDGNAVAGWWISFQHENGNGVERNQKLADEWLERAAEAGAHEAALSLGRKCDREGNFEQGAHWYRISAEQGNLEAMACLGTDYLIGEGVQKDGAEGVKWLKPAALQGNLHAQHNLGRAYHRGIGVIRNQAIGIKWIRRAAESGDLYANERLAYIYRNGDGVEVDEAEAMRCFKISAQGGLPWSQLAVGLGYWLGAAGCEKDEHVAYKWLRLSAFQGNARAACVLGQMHSYGAGVPKSAEKAVEWFRKSAGMGDDKGMFELGRCYLCGDGVDFDPAEAAYWFSQAIDLGNVDAAFYIGLMLKNGTGVETNFAEASRWFLMAAEKGLSAAQYELGILYAEGKGLVRNIEEAGKWMALAAGSGHEDAAKWLEENEVEPAEPESPPPREVAPVGEA